ncbi:MAG: EAL domain-containing protein [Pyrinomonadaceae bacterium]|nr:EAL domain-containing protein [Pyrinomonadaceae bacterium]
MHPLLDEQLKRLSLKKDTLPSIRRWQSFLSRVNSAYAESDQERLLMERSLRDSSKDMQGIYDQLRESENRYFLAAQGANDGLWDWDLIHDDTYYSSRWLEILGLVFPEGHKPGRDCWLDRIHPNDRDKVVKELDSHLDGKTHHFENEHRVKHTDGSYRWVLIRGLAVRDDEGKACRIAGSLTDITARKRTEEKLEHDAAHDALTGLPNRKRLKQCLETSIRRIKHDSRNLFAVLFIDIDRFKTINDSMGHQAGDELLLTITRKLNSLVRPNDVVARLGGDEFVILVENIKDRDQVLQIAERILITLQQPMKILGQKIYTSASVGIAMGSGEYEKPEDLVRDADIAMYRAKTNGKGRFEVFDEGMHSGAVSLMKLEIDLRRAYEKKEFVLHYQPIVALESEEIIGFEALVRWNHPVRGMVPPSEFIPVAEDTGLILPIGQWVLQESCRQMSQWQREHDSSRSMIISVNLSARQIERKSLIEEIAQTLTTTELPPECLRLEITESVIMNNPEQAIVSVNDLREMGVRVSIDDFGTGYSSLGYLHKFPVDTLKVDRSFINRIGNEGENAEIVQTIITLAASLNMEVVAEGIETAEQLDFLRHINCNYGQGYFYSRPVDSEGVGEMLGKLSAGSALVEPLVVNEDAVNELLH